MRCTLLLLLLLAHARAQLLPGEDVSAFGPRQTVMVLVQTSLSPQDFSDRLAPTGAILLSATESFDSLALWQFQANIPQFSLLRAALSGAQGLSVLAFSTRGDDPMAAAPLAAESVSTALWNLDRIDQRSLPLNGQYNPGPGYDGEGVRAYVVDTGVYDHPDLEGRVVQAYTGYSTYTDENGHGTHVAGIIASKTYGVAKKATIVSYRVLNAQGSGTLGVLANALMTLKGNLITPCVINLSLTYSGYDAVLDSILRDIIALGGVVVAAAGNSNKDACTTYPCVTSGVICVGSTTILDQRSSFSNFGLCVDVMLPGSNIRSLGKTGTDTAVLSGTSMASPHAAGIVALYLGQNPYTATSVMTQLIIDRSTKNAILPSTIGAGTPNRLGYAVWDALPTVSTAATVSSTVASTSSATVMDTASTTSLARTTTVATTTNSASLSAAVTSTKTASTLASTTAAVSTKTASTMSTSTTRASSTLAATNTKAATSTVRATSTASTYATTTARSTSTTAARSTTTASRATTTSSRATTTAAASSSKVTPSSVSGGGSATALQPPHLFTLVLMCTAALLAVVQPW